MGQSEEVRARTALAYKQSCASQFQGWYDRLMYAHFVPIMQPSRLDPRSNPIPCDYSLLRAQHSKPWNRTQRYLYMHKKYTESNKKQAVAPRLRHAPLEVNIDPAIKHTCCLDSHYRMKMESDLPQKLRDLLAWSRPIAMSSRLPIKSHSISSVKS
jgi:hypothetical protein